MTNLKLNLSSQGRYILPLHGSRHKAYSHTSPHNPSKNGNSLLLCGNGLSKMESVTKDTPKEISDALSAKLSQLTLSGHGVSIKKSTKKNYINFRI